MPNVYRRRPEFIVAEELPAGGTVSTRDGIRPVGAGDMAVLTGGDSTHYSAADFSRQFELVSYDDAPLNLREIADPERAQKERLEFEEAEAKKEERSERAAERRVEREKGERATARQQAREARAAERGKTTKLESPRRDMAKEAEERRAKEEVERAQQHHPQPVGAAQAGAHDEHSNPAQAHLQAEGDFGPQPTPEAQRTHGE